MRSPPAGHRLHAKRYRGRAGGYMNETDGRGAIPCSQCSLIVSVRGVKYRRGYGPCGVMIQALVNRYPPNEIYPCPEGARLLVGLAAGDKINIIRMNKEISLIGGFSRKHWHKVGTDGNGQHYSRPFTWKEYFKTWLNIELMFALFRFQARKYIRCLRNKT